MTAEEPRNFVAWGRLFAGLAISVGGAILLHRFHTRELATFAVVVSAAGLVLNVWGFLGTVLYQKATTEDVFWAYVFLNLLLIALVLNLHHNGPDYGVHWKYEHTVRALWAISAANIAAYFLPQMFGALPPPSVERVSYRRRELFLYAITFVLTITLLFYFGAWLSHTPPVRN